MFSNCSLFFSPFSLDYLIVECHKEISGVVKQRSVGDPKRGAYIEFLRMRLVPHVVSCSCCWRSPPTHTKLSIPPGRWYFIWFCSGCVFVRRLSSPFGWPLPLLSPFRPCILAIDRNEAKRCTATPSRGECVDIHGHHRHCVTQTRLYTYTANCLRVNSVSTTAVNTPLVFSAIPSMPRSGPICLVQTFTHTHTHKLMLHNPF